MPPSGDWLSEFDDFFQEVNDGHCPFPWQTMLLERLLEGGGWPKGIDLPTASGKTACLDVAVFALSVTDEDVQPVERPPRRIFFVVDRRIVVDAAFDRANRIARALEAPKREATRKVADRLRTLAGLADDDTPLMVSRLRGGTTRDLRWREDPRRAAIVTGTVDQVGSRLLFRGYGTRPRTAPIDAALTACDSLILVDEAHCAVPFLRTAKSIAERYHTGAWMEEAIVPRLRVSILSATLPEDVSDIFPAASERDEALGHRELRRRIESPKRAELAVARKPSAAQLRRRGRALWEDLLVVDAADRALSFAESGKHQRIAVMVNRVRTATKIHEQLQRWVGAKARVGLMTGRMRPVDREELVGGLKSLESRPKGKREDLEVPLILVTTQCLEVGADFSFDALVTECASLDALRQRFGRLDRLGDVYERDEESVPAAVLIRKADTKRPSKKAIREGEVDPIYGEALPATWAWLKSRGESVFDFGIGALDARLSQEPSAKRDLSAPVDHAPVLLPAHLDAWVQTSPRPYADPEPGLFLHGPDRGVPEVQVVFRADLVPPSEGEREGDWKSRWIDALGLVPPLTAEAISIPLGQARRWLAGQRLRVGGVTDVETQRELAQDEEGEASDAIPFVLWRGREESWVGPPSGAIRPHETLVVPAVEDWAARLGPLFQRSPERPLDVAEEAYRMARDRTLLRLHPGLLPKGEDRATGLHAFLADVLRDGGWNAEQLRASLEQALREPELPDAFKDRVLGGLEALDDRGTRTVPHPDAGVVVLGRSLAGLLDEDEFSDEDDLASESPQPVTLARHSEWVSEEAEGFARSCLREDLAESFRLSGCFHDLGKADGRMQAFLQGSELAAARSSHPLAKGTPLRTARQRWSLRNAVELPKGFRHEMLSMQLMERWLEGAAGHLDRDLLLHLVASHHGCARPFAPVVWDDDPVEVKVDVPGLATDVGFTSQERKGLLPPERLESGVADRFWILTRRYGWWGLAYVEALFRLADWKASRRSPEDTPSESEAA